MPELRKDPVIGRWVIIATERRKRPSDFKVMGETCSIDYASCPFCTGNETKTPPEIMAYRDGTPKNSPGWSVRVVPNKFPALAIEGGLGRVGEGMFDKMNGVGAHEVIIETPRHVCNYDALSEPEVANIVRAYRDRVIDLKGDKRLQYILIFKNKGREAGASLEHTHSQLIALPIVPKRVSEELKGSQEYFRFKDRCVFCDIIRQEMQDGIRVVAENDHFILLSPFAPKSPFETWVLPKEHQSTFELIKDDQLYSLAKILHLLMKKMADVLSDPPFNYIVHTAPLHQDPAHYHWHIEVMPKLTQVAGFEWGSGFYINPTPPEDAAEALRSGNNSP
ncbi:MAG TPA: galactose-1-phosphate uridylyltransferase [bacterium]|nr:galactose-1-phosphate uridylyltransferase [bacterium]